MRAYVTSVGERTTDLSIWALERNGFEVVLVKDTRSLYEKLRFIYSIAEGDFVRVDADVIVNSNFTPSTVGDLKTEDIWWIQFITYDWIKQDLTHGGAQFISKQALPILRDKIDMFEKAERPESQMFRLDDFHSPRRCVTYTQEVMGLHGYGQDDLSRVKDTKDRRNQTGYDWDLVERIARLED